MAVGLATSAELGSGVRITAVTVGKGESVGNDMAGGVETGRAGAAVSTGRAVATELFGGEVGVCGSAGVSSEQALIDTPKTTQQTSTKSPYRAFNKKFNLYSGEC